MSILKNLEVLKRVSEEKKAKAFELQEVSRASIMYKTAEGKGKAFHVLHEKAQKIIDRYREKPESANLQEDIETLEAILSMSQSLYGKMQEMEEKSPGSTHNFQLNFLVASGSPVEEAPSPGKTVEAEVLE